MISYIGVEPHLKNKLQSGYHCKAQKLKLLHKLLLKML
jgi:hypothetical protein